MEIMFYDPQVQAAIIEAIGTIIGSLVASICAGLIGRQYLDRKKLQEDLNTAMGDIEFLLAVENEHCSIHRLGVGESNKIRVRNEVVSQGMFWSGRFTHSRIRRRMSGVRNAEGSGYAAP